MSNRADCKAAQDDQVTEQGALLCVLAEEMSWQLPASNSHQAAAHERSPKTFE